jgi:phosphatidylglycerophosphate synthase
MTFYGKRGKFDGLSKKIGKSFAKLGLSPNQWTLVSVIPAIASAYFIIQQEYIPAAALFIIAAFLDMVDGAVARATGKASAFGAYLDTMVDRYVEFLIVAALMYIAAQGMIPSLFMPAVMWILLYYVGAIMTSYSKAAAKEKDLITKEIKGGLIERAERLLILFAGISLASADVLYLTYTIIILAFLTNVTVVQRALLAVRHSKS